MTDKDSKIAIRNLDHLLYQNARIAAILAGQNVGEWLNAAIVLKLAKDQKAKKK